MVFVPSSLEGWLMKDKKSAGSRLLGDKTRRWFTVTKLDQSAKKGGEKLALCYYKNQGGGEPRGWMFMHDVTSVRELGPPLQFVVEHPSRSYVLRAPTEREFRTWVDGLRECLVEAKEDLKALAKQQPPRTAFSFEQQQQKPEQPQKQQSRLQEANIGRGGGDDEKRLFEYDSVYSPMKTTRPQLSRRGSSGLSARDNGEEENMDDLDNELDGILDDTKKQPPAKKKTREAAFDYVPQRRRDANNDDFLNDEEGRSPDRRRQSSNDDAPSPSTRNSRRRHEELEAEVEGSRKRETARQRRHDEDEAEGSRKQAARQRRQDEDEADSKKRETDRQRRMDEDEAERTRKRDTARQRRKDEEEAAEAEGLKKREELRQRRRDDEEEERREEEARQRRKEEVAAEDARQEEDERRRHERRRQRRIAAEKEEQEEEERRQTRTRQSSPDKRAPVDVSPLRSPDRELQQQERRAFPDDEESAAQRTARLRALERKNSKKKKKEVEEKAPEEEAPKKTKKKKKKLMESPTEFDDEIDLGLLEPDRPIRRNSPSPTKDKGETIRKFSTPTNAAPLVENVVKKKKKKNDVVEEAVQEKALPAAKIARRGAGGDELEIDWGGGAKKNRLTGKKSALARRLEQGAGKRSARSIKATSPTKDDSDDEDDDLGLGAEKERIQRARKMEEARRDSARASKEKLKKLTAVVKKPPAHLNNGIIADENFVDQDWDDDDDFEFATEEPPAPKKNTNRSPQPKCSPVVKNRTNRTTDQNRTSDRTGGVAVDKDFLDDWD